MNADEVKTTVETIVADLEAVSSIAAGVDPALIPFIAIGRAVAKQLPGLAAAVTSWIEGNPPSDAEKQALLDQIKMLGDPNLP